MFRARFTFLMLIADLKIALNQFQNDYLHNLICCCCFEDVINHGLSERLNWIRSLMISSIFTHYATTMIDRYGFIIVRCHISTTHSTFRMILVLLNLIFSRIFPELARWETRCFKIVTRSPSSQVVAKLYLSHINYLLSFAFIKFRNDNQ